VNPQLPRFGGGPLDSVVHPLVLIALELTILLIFALRKKHVVVPVVFMAFLVPIGQQFVVAGVHLFVLRIVILVALIRAVQGKGKFRWNSVDTVFTVGVIFQAISVIILNQTPDSMVNQVGFLWDFLGGYFLLRVLIADDDDIDTTIKSLAVVVVLMAIAMTTEHAIQRNVFGQLGGVRLIPEIRNGSIRAQGAFQHPLTAGAFGASCLPLFFYLWKRKTANVLAILGMVAACIVTVSTHTSTSALTAVAALVGIAFWPLRTRMRLVRRMLFGAVIGLDLVMKAPVWYLIARIDLTGASSSYQRAFLVDQFVKHFSSWWLIGTQANANWGWGMWDVQNTYVETGQSGGLVALVCFIAVIAYSFRRVGQLRRSVSGSPEEWIPWLLGATLFAHTVAFFGVQYYDQVRMAWFATLAMISACTVAVAQSRTASKPGRTASPLYLGEVPADLVGCHPPEA